MIDDAYCNFVLVIVFSFHYSLQNDRNISISAIQYFDALFAVDPVYTEIIKALGGQVQCVLVDYLVTGLLWPAMGWNNTLPSEIY